MSTNYNHPYTPNNKHHKHHKHQNNQPPYQQDRRHHYRLHQPLIEQMNRDNFRRHLQQVNPHQFQHHNTHHRQNHNNRAPPHHSQQTNNNAPILGKSPHEPPSPGFGTGRRTRAGDPASQEHFDWDDDTFPDTISNVSDDGNGEAVLGEGCLSDSDSDDDQPTSQIPSELRDNTVAAQEYDAYMASTAHRSRRAGKMNLADSIDPIDGALVAKFQVKELFKRIRANSLCQKENLSRGMSILQGKSINHMLASDDEVREARKKKAIEKEPRAIQPMVAAALRYLMTSARFLIGTLNPKKILGCDPETHCGAFFVEKSNGMLRVILDGRYANIYFKPEASQFSFFKLETLRNVIGNLSQHEKWYALNYDLRHWFHQIPLPTIYCKYLGMKMTDRRGDAGTTYWGFPRSLPMGFLQAPFVAQTCAWGTVLSQKYGASWKGSDLDMKYLERMRNNGSPLPWVPLKKGGGIFVFLDNILVVTPDKEVAKWWRTKIIQDCHDLHAWLKGNKKHDMTAPPKQQEETLSDCFVELSPDEGSFDFLGVRWTHNGRAVILKDELDEKKTIPGAKRGVWKGSRRLMAGILGKLLWYRRVHGITYFDDETNDETKTILSIYKRLSPPVNPELPTSNKRAWDAAFTITKQELTHLTRAWIRRANKTVSTAEVLPKMDPSTADILFAITDAAITAVGVKGGALAAGCWYSVGGECIQASSRRPDQSVPTAAHLEQRSVMQRFVGEEGIAFGEMLAIKVTIEAALKNRPSANIIALATDNMSCKYWIEKGHSRNSNIQRLLKEIHQLLHQHNNCRLFVTYVNTKENFADQISRNEEVDDYKINLNHELLKRALDEATASLWLVGGGLVGGTTQ